MADFASTNSGKPVLLTKKFGDTNFNQVRRKNGVDIGVFEMEVDTTLGNGSSVVGWEINTAFGDYQIYWGDGSVIETNGVLHSFGSSGTYTIRTLGAFGIEDFAGTGGALQGKVTKINNWACFVPVQQNNGDFGWLRDSVQDDSGAIGTYPIAVAEGFNTPAGSVFASSDGDFVSLGSWVFKSGVQYSYERMFESCTAYTGGGIGSWQDELGTAISFTGVGVFRMFTGNTVMNTNLNSWDVSDCTNFATIFRSCPAFNSPLDAWDVSNGESFSSMFQGCTVFDQDISGWQITTDPAKSVSMTGMFSSGASAFTGSLATVGTAWNMNRVTSINGMFESSQARPSSLTNWNISICTDLRDFARSNSQFNADCSNWTLPTVAFDAEYMFFSAKLFAGTGLNTWDMSNCTSFFRMFDMDNAVNRRNDVFNPNLSSWDVSNGGTGGYRSMFEGCFVFNSGSASGVSNTALSQWTFPTTGSYSFQRMFNQCQAFNSDISYDAVNGYWDTSNVNLMSQMFSSCSTFNQDISGWNTASVTSMASMFQSASVFNQNLGSWSQALLDGTGISAMFYNARDFNNGGSPDIDNWDTSALTTFNRVFRGASDFNQDLNSWNTALVESFREMFYGATSFSAGTLSGWERTTPGDVSTVASVTDFTRMFRATDFNGDISGWNVSGAETFDQMFHSCNTFNRDISGWDVSGVDDFAAMFYRADSFDRDLSGWNLSSATDMSLMFTQLGGLSDTNVSSILIGWEASANTATGVNATQLFGNRTMNQTTYATAKTAYDNLATAVGSGGKGWNLTNAITWV
jgi:surface protein